jgi:hypothetical protein
MKSKTPAGCGGALLQSEFQDSQSYTEKPCLEKPKKKKGGGDLSPQEGKHENQ